MIYTQDELTTLLSRSGGAIHLVDGEELFCRIKGLAVERDEYGRVMGELQELSYITGETYDRRVRHDVVVNGSTWSIVSVREKISGITIWTMERNRA